MLKPISPTRTHAAILGLGGFAAIVVWVIFATVGGQLAPLHGLRTAIPKVIDASAASHTVTSTPAPAPSPPQVVNRPVYGGDDGGDGD
jgi:hypothetical protein